MYKQEQRTHTIAIHIDCQCQYQPQSKGTGAKFQQSTCSTPTCTGTSTRHSTCAGTSTTHSTCAGTSTTHSPCTGTSTTHSPCAGTSTTHSTCAGTSTTHSPGHPSTADEACLAKTCPAQWVILFFIHGRPNCCLQLKELWFTDFIMYYNVRTCACTVILHEQQLTIGLEIHVACPLGVYFTSSIPNTALYTDDSTNSTVLSIGLYSHRCACVCEWEAYNL